MDGVGSSETIGSI